MNKLFCKQFAIDILSGIISNDEQAKYSYHNQQLFIDGKLSTIHSNTWSTEMFDVRAKYFLEKSGLLAADLAGLGQVWIQALEQDVLSGGQLKKIGEKNLSITTLSDEVLNQWRRMIDARIMNIISEFDTVENLSCVNSQKIEQPLELAPLLHTWPERLLNHPHWACAESPLPDIPPLPLDEIWVDLHVTEPLEDEISEDMNFPQILEQRYKDSQWLNMPVDFVLESLRGTMLLVGAPGIGKTTLLKWIARRLIKQSDGRFLLPLFISLRAYALSKAQNPKVDLVSFSLQACGIQSKQQIEKWSNILRFFSGTEHSNVLLLLDGWDEVPNEMREMIIYEIKELGYSFSMIITSRPSAYPKTLPADQLYEISDLLPENITILVQQWHNLLKKPQQADSLIAHLKNHPDLSHLARNPFLLNLLCAINIEGGLNGKKLPRNRTELYTYTLDYIYDYQSNNSTLDFNRQHKRQTRELALWLLSEAPNYPQYLFGINDIRLAENIDNIKSKTNNVDLLVSVLKSSRLLSQWHIDKESLHFLHTTFQEYLASEALLQLDKDKRIKLIKREIYNPAWQEILCFLSGQTSDVEHDYWQVIRQLAAEQDQYGLIDIRLSKLIAETGCTDGGKTLLGFDLRDRLWEHIKSGVCTNYFVQAYAQLDPEDYISRLKYISTIKSEQLKARLIRSLKKIATQEASQTLVDNLLFGNKNEAAVASYAVENVIDATGIQTLRHALQDKNIANDRKQIIVRALGNTKDYISIPFLRQLYDSLPELKKEILNALGHIGGQKAANVLENLLMHASDTEKINIIAALGHAFDLPSRNVLIKELAKIAPNSSVLADILEALTEIPLSHNSELISLYLSLEFPEDIRVKAIWALMEATETYITERLANLGEFEDSEPVRIAALGAMRNRARYSDLKWLISRVKNRECNSVERANAFESILSLYKKSKQGLNALYHEASSIHAQVLNLTTFVLSQTSKDLNITAAAGAYILGKDIAPALMEICENPIDFSDSVRESACTSLGKIRYKPALKLFNHWIERSPSSPDDEEIPLLEIDDRLASCAANAYVQTDLIGAVQHSSLTVRIAVGKFALKHGYLIFSDRIISPGGKVLEQTMTVHTGYYYPELDSKIAADKQTNNLRKVCLFLLDNKHAKKSGRLSGSPPPLFKKHSETYTDYADSIDANTGEKFLKGATIRADKAEVLKDWVLKKFPWVFIK